MINTRRPEELRIPGNGEPALSMWTLATDRLHLNHGSFGAVTKETQKIQNLLRAQMDREPTPWFSCLPAKIGAAREGVSRVFGVDPYSMAFVANASAGATVVYNAQPYRAGGDVLVTNHGYGAVSMGALRLAARWGGQLITAEVPLESTPEQATEAVKERITRRTGLIVIDQITSSTARVLPAKEIALYAAELGIPVLVDGAHVPGLHDDWIANQPWTYWIGNLHKFACAPRGTAMLLKNPNENDPLYPLIDSWGAHSSYPESFDVQGTLDLTSYLCAESAWKQIEDTWGWSVVNGYQEELTAYGTNVICGALGARTGQDHHVDVGQPVRGMRLVRLPEGLISDHNSADAVRNRFALETGSEISFTEFGGNGYLRLSAHAYNTPTHYEEFAERFVPLLLKWTEDARHNRREQ